MNANGTFTDAVREMGGLTVTVERRVLHWIAPRLPAWVNADHLTVLAIVAMAMAGAAYWLSSTHVAALWLVNLCLAINWFGDSLDGTVARIRHQQRPRYGFYVDHVVDAAGLSMLIGGMALSGFISPLVALGVLSAYLLLCIEVYLATYTLGTFRMSMFKVGPTELRLLLASGNAATWWWSPGPARQFDLPGLVIIGLLVTAFLTSLVHNTVTLSRAEPRPVSCRPAPHRRDTPRHSAPVVPRPVPASPPHGQA